MGTSRSTFVGHYISGRKIVYPIADDNYVCPANKKHLVKVDDKYCSKCGARTENVKRNTTRDYGYRDHDDDLLEKFLNDLNIEFVPGERLNNECWDYFVFRTAASRANRDLADYGGEVRIDSDLLNVVSRPAIEHSVVEGVIARLQNDIGYLDLAVHFGVLVIIS